MLKLFIIVGDILLIISSLWYRNRMKKLLQELTDYPDEVKVQDEDTTFFLNRGLTVAAGFGRLLKTVPMLFPNATGHRCTNYNG